MDMKPLPVPAGVGSAAGTPLVRRALRRSVLLVAVAVPIVALGVAVGGHPVSASAVGQERQPQRWKGVMRIPNQTLEFVVEFQPAGDGESWTATIDIPAQGAQDLPLTDVRLSAEAMAFTIAQAPPAGAHFTATIAEDGRTASGELEQGGARFPIELERLAEGEEAGPPRPQHPRPPFPYEAREVAYDNPADGARLAGTLTVPAGAGPHPAALLITGSGGQDRDETILGHKPFLVIADRLTRDGIAVLRVDDRGVGGSTGPIVGLTSETFAGDVRAGIAFLARQAEIDAGRIGLIGHSEGGLIAALVAADSDDVAFAVLLAGPGLPGREIMPLQLERIQRALGRPDDNVRDQVAAQRRLLELVASGAEFDRVREAVGDLVRVQIAAQPESLRPSGDDLERLIDTHAAPMRATWWRFFLTADPRDYLRRVRCPVLALIGSLDLQVPADANLPEIEAALGAAPTDDFTVRELEGLNHLFQPARTGSPVEYARIETTIAPEALELVSAWIREHTGRS